MSTDDKPYGLKLVGAFVLVAVVIAGLVLLVLWAANELDASNELEIGLVVVVGLIALPLVIALTSAMRSYFGGQPGQIRLGEVGNFALLVILAAAFTVGTVATVVIAARQLRLGDVFRPELALPLLLITSLIALVVALATLVAAFHLFGLKDPSKPFGVPEGTLQAVIARTDHLLKGLKRSELEARIRPSAGAQRRPSDPSVPPVVEFKA